MRILFARCTMLFLLVGGFALTGDAGWLARQAEGLLNATTVPSCEPPRDVQVSDFPAVAQDMEQPSVDVFVTPSLALPAEAPPPGGGEPVVDLRLLRAGQRLRLWVGGGMVVFDMVDPKTGEAIQQPIPRRVWVTGTGDPHRIERGESIVIQRRPGISGHIPPDETVGPIQAITM